MTKYSGGKIMTAVFVDRCPNCKNQQEALVGYLSHCLVCGHDWRSYRDCNTQPVLRFHNFTDEAGEYNDFVATIVLPR